MAAQWQVPVLVRYRFVDASGQVAGYGLRMAAPHGTDESTVGEALDDEYRRTDLTELADERMLCVPATPALLAEAGELLGPEHVVQVPANLLASAQVAALAAQGVRLAVGGFTATPAQLDALEWAEMVVVDAEDEHLDDLVAASGDTAVLALGPGSRASVDRAVAAGASLVETTWVYADDPREPGDLNAVEAQCLALLAVLDQQPAEPDKITETISTSPELSVAVLRHVNSTAAALRHRVDSVRHAAVLAGPRRLRTIAVAELSGSRQDGIDALWAILARARTVADLTGREAGYTAGLLSGLADVRRFPLDWLATRAGVSPQVSTALLARRGSLGAAVAAVAAHEAGQPADVAALGMDPWVVSRAWTDALVETRSMLPDLR
ncbi:MAG: HDOD domain-containing protein [Micrococcales bacterium]|nr:HDOD domain-containing protein [Micrococcales bacterium]